MNWTCGTVGRWLMCLGAVCLLGDIPGCASYQPPPDSRGKPAGSRVTGIVTARVRTILPQDALLRVELVEISPQDAPPRTINLKEVWTEGRQFPLPFDIPYSNGAIDSDRYYALQVRINQGSRILFTNTAVYKVITNGVRSNVEVVVEPVPGSGGVSR